MLHPHFEFAVIVHGGCFELRVERAGLFAYSEHLLCSTRKEPRARQGLSQTLALHHLIANVLNTFAIDGVVRSICGDSHRLREIDPCPYHG